MLDAMNDAEREIAQDCPGLPTLEKSSQVDDASLNERKRAAIELLAMGRSYSHAAKDLGIGRRTLFNWRQEESFRAELRRRQQELWQEPSERLGMLLGPSIEVMAEHLEDNYDRSRFRAASMVLRLMQKQLTREEE